MLVAACDSCHQNNRDIAMNMMEIALDELQSMNPQDVEDSIQIVSVVDGDPVDSIIESACFNDEFEDEETVNMDTLLDSETANTVASNVQSLTDDAARQVFRESIMKMFVQA